MERRYGIPYLEVSFFGGTEIAKAMRGIAKFLDARIAGDFSLRASVEAVIKAEEKKLKEALKPYSLLRGKKAVLYTGGVKSWSFISALRDLGIEIVAVGTKKSTFEDEEKMKELLGPDAPLVEDVAPGNLLKLLKERSADMLIAGGRNQYLAVKEGYPFVDVNQERHTAYAGYEGLVNLAEQISNGLRFYGRRPEWGVGSSERSGLTSQKAGKNSELRTPDSELKINPLKHSPAIGAAIAFQGIHRALPVIHGAQGCGFLGKVLLTKHFREPIALATSKLFVEDVVMGSEEKLEKTLQGFIEKNSPDVIGVLTSGLVEVKGDDTADAVKQVKIRNPKAEIVHVSTPDYDGGLETGYARAVEAVVGSSEFGVPPIKKLEGRLCAESRHVNVLAGSHLTPADFTELREIIRSFGLSSVMLPDLSALDGSREGISALASGGTNVRDLQAMGSSRFTIVLGRSLEPAAKSLRDKTGVAYRVFDGLAGLADTDALMETLSELSGNPVPALFGRHRRMLIDAMRDAHFFYGGRNACIALEPDHAVQMSRWLAEMGATVERAVIPALSDAAGLIRARDVEIGDLFSIKGKFDLLISNSHAEDTAKRLGAPLYQAGFPVYKILGYPQKVMIGYRGTLAMINEVGNLLMKGH
jgi:nitrogenase molybdenum-cofactor synthesis protein NifE